MNGNDGSRGSFVARKLAVEEGEGRSPPSPPTRRPALCGTITPLPRKHRRRAPNTPPAVKTYSLLHGAVGIRGAFVFTIFGAERFRGRRRSTGFIPN